MNKPAQSAARIMAEAGIPNLLEGRKLRLNVPGSAPDKEIMQGPNVKSLITRWMSMLSPGNIDIVAKEATELVTAAIALVKATPDNPYGDDDEAIAGEILRQIRAKEAKANNG